MLWLLLHAFTCIQHEFLLHLSAALSRAVQEANRALELARNYELPRHHEDHLHWDL